MAITALKKPQKEPERIKFDSDNVKPARIHIVIDGVTPLLTHNPESMGIVKEPSKASRIPAPADEAEAGTYRMADGTCALKGEGFRCSLLYAASGYKGVKRGTMKPVLSHIIVVQELISLMRRDGTPISDYVIDKRRVIVQKQGIVRCRPLFEEWSCEVVFEYDPQLVEKPAIIPTILHDAGKRFGVGDYRPRFGRYRVREYWLE